MPAHALLEDAFAHHRAGRLDQAEALYRDVLLHDPDNLNALQLLGAIASDTLRHQDAVVWLDRAAVTLLARGTASAQHAALYYNWGNALIAVGRTAEAIEAYRAGLALDPAMPELWARLAAALVQAGDPTGAAAAYEAALKLKPGQTDLLLMLGSVNAGLGRQEAAVDLFCRVLAVEPENTEAQRALGLALVSLDRPPEAIEPFATAGRNRFSTQQWHVAAARFARSMVLHPGDAETHWMLGRVEEAQCEFDARRRPIARHWIWRPICRLPCSTSARCSTGNGRNRPTLSCCSIGWLQRRRIMSGCIAPVATRCGSCT